MDYKTQYALAYRLCRLLEWEDYDASLDTEYASPKQIRNRDRRSSANKLAMLRSVDPAVFGRAMLSFQTSIRIDPPPKGRYLAKYERSLNTKLRALHSRESALRAQLKAEIVYQGPPEIIRERTQVVERIREIEGILTAMGKQPSVRYVGISL